MVVLGGGGGSYEPGIPASSPRCSLCRCAGCQHPPTSPSPPAPLVRPTLPARGTEAGSYLRLIDSCITQLFEAHMNRLLYHSAAQVSRCVQKIVGALGGDGDMGFLAFPTAAVRSASNFWRASMLPYLLFSPASSRLHVVWNAFSNCQGGGESERGVRSQHHPASMGSVSNASFQCLHPGSQASPRFPRCSPTLHQVM